ncbi:MAG: hypothetical protein WCD77_08000, partial [Acidobacteriaceae bacterium]
GFHPARSRTLALDALHLAVKLEKDACRLSLERFHSTCELSNINYMQAAFDGRLRRKQLLDNPRCENAATVKLQ